MIAPGEVQAPGTEQLVALERLAEQIDPILCEVQQVTPRGLVPCGWCAEWSEKGGCPTHSSGQAFVCDRHKNEIEEQLLAGGHGHCTRCGACIPDPVWTKL